MKRKGKIVKRKKKGNKWKIYTEIVKPWVFLQWQC